MITYCKWFKPSSNRFRRQFYTKYLHHPRDIICVAHLRMGCHKLDIERRRWGSRRVDRSQRKCACCGLGIVEDEMHFMLECPVYDGIRRHLLLKLEMDGVVSDANMKSICCGNSEAQWHAIARFIKTGFYMRAAKVAEIGRAHV